LVGVVAGWKGNGLRVLYVYAGAGSPVLQYERQLAAEITSSQPDIDIDFWDWTGDMRLPANPTFAWAKANTDTLRPFYKRLKQRASNADVTLISQTGGILPDEMSELPGTVVYNTADDPDSSDTCSFPFLKAADVIAHAGVNFDAGRTIAEVFIERGAKRCVHFPIGFYDELFPRIEDFDAQFDKRDVELVYIGHLKRGKLEPLMRHFRKMVVHSRSLGLKHKLYIFAKTAKWVTPYRKDLGALYRRSQVGVNLHFSYGPSNARCYQLPACGVAQVADCSEGMGQIYEKGKEVIVYSKPAEAIECIEKLLADTRFRYNVAKDGYVRARGDYNRRDVLVRMLRSL